jgi:hypothetical protein
MAEQTSDARVTLMQPTIYSIYYGDEGGSSSVRNVDHYIIIRKLLDSIFSIYIQYSYTGAKLKHIYVELFFHMVAYTKYNIPWCVQYMDFQVLKFCTVKNTSFVEWKKKNIVVTQVT